MRNTRVHLPDISIASHYKTDRNDKQKNEYTNNDLDGGDDPDEEESDYNTLG